VDAKCKTLLMDWADADSAELRRLLSPQKFAAVVGVELVYSSAQARLAPIIIQNALPKGGKAIIMNAMFFRDGVEEFGQALERAGFGVKVTVLEPEGIDPSVWGDYEPGQKYRAYEIDVPALAPKQGRQSSQVDPAAAGGGSK
jgi:hypothetical protein